MKLYLLLAFLPVVIAFDFYIYSTTWAPTFCAINPTKCTGNPINNFIIHGLWPQDYNQSYPQFCQPCYPFDKNMLNEMEEDLKKYWSDTGVIDWQFLEHEWDKHGCCTDMEQKEYFEKVLELRKKWDFKRVFESIGIYPNSIVRLDIIKQAAEDFCGNRCTIVFNCLQNKLETMFMSLGKNLSIIRYNMMDSCGSEFLW